MTPWQNERWSTAPTNDGKNFAPAHRWAVVKARPLCFGGIGVGKIRPCSECIGNIGACSALCIVSFANDPIWCLSDALNRAWEQAKSLAKEVGWQREFVHELRQRIATLEAENAALRQNQPHCPNCGHRLDTEECGCGGGK